MGTCVRRFIALVVLCSCRSPTEIVLDLTTDVPCDKASAGGANITVGRFEELERKPPAATTTACTPGVPLNSLGTVVLIPSGADDEPVSVRVVLGVDSPAETCTRTEGIAPDYTGCIVARRSLRYSPHESLRLPIELRKVCEGHACPGQTCVMGSCVASTIPDPAACTTDEACGDHVLLPPDAEPPDAGAPMDAGESDDVTIVDASDAGADADADAGDADADAGDADAHAGDAGKDANAGDSGFPLPGCLDAQDGGCAPAGSRASCFECCSQACSIDGTAPFYMTIWSCVCDAGQCTGSCASSVCAAPPASTTQCSLCLVDAGAASCSSLYQSCRAETVCGAFVHCAEKCP
jgi:hypothetical protein